MSFRKISILAVITLIAAAALSACSSAETYGTIPQNTPVTAVKNVVLNPQAGATVLVAGTVKTQCGSNGCWFFLDDGTGQLLVMLNALNLGLPQSVGKTAEVYGTVNIVEQQAAISARGLRVK